MIRRPPSRAAAAERRWSTINRAQKGTLFECIKDAWSSFGGRSYFTILSFAWRLIQPYSPSVA